MFTRYLVWQLSASEFHGIFFCNPVDCSHNTNRSGGGHLGLIFDIRACDSMFTTSGAFLCPSPPQPLRSLTPPACVSCAALCRLPNLPHVLQLFNLAPFSALRSVTPLEAVLTPPVAVDNVSRVAAAGAMGLVPNGVLLVDDINRLAKDV